MRLSDDIEAMATAFGETSGGELHVVVDPVCGAPARAALEAASPGARIVQLGQSAAPEASVSSATLRGKALTLLGHTNFAVPAAERRAAYERLADHAARGELAVEVERIPLEEIASAWERQGSSPRRKLVVVP